MDHCVAGAVSQFHGRPGSKVSLVEMADKRRIRNLALGLMSLALAFYFGFIAIAIYRSHH
jgi:hypothetical protein